MATAFLDLTQIASMGAFLYLTMDIAVQLGVIRHLRDEIDAKPWLPAITIILDLAILVPFTIFKVQSDLLTVVIAAAVAAVIFLAQIITVRARSRADAA